MILRRIKALISQGLYRQPQVDAPTEKPNADAAKDPLTEINARIQANDSISPAMKQLANRLVVNYVPTINLSYKACLEGSVVKAHSIGRDINELYNGIGNHVTDCLLDIEKGADFEDRFSDVFLSNLLDFESALELQNQKDCR